MAAQILVDCASSGTKMYLAIQRADTSHVSNTEVGSMPPVHGFLQNLRESTEELALLQDFRANLDKALARLSELALDVSPQAVVIGLTSWWRKLRFAEREEVYELLLRDLRTTAEEATLTRCHFEPLLETTEIVLEREAVAYAAQHVLGYEDVDLVLSGGNNSINLLPSPGKYQTPSTSVDLSLMRGQEQLIERGLEVWNSECFVQLDRAAGIFCKELLMGSRAPQRLRVVAIGSNYWGGRDADLADSLEEHSLPDVLARIEARLQVHLVDRSDGWAKECANLVRLRSCLERLFPGNLHRVVSVVFARDWLIHGEPFRTTWTSGYFIRHGMLGHRACSPQHASLSWSWLGQPSSPWLNLTSRDSDDLQKVLWFDDSEDNEMHEVSYSRRMQLKDVMVVQPFTYNVHTPAAVVWTQAALSPHLVGLAQHGHNPGIEIWLPSADSLSRFVVVGLVSACVDTASSAFPRPALGFNRRVKDLFPVVDLGIAFDAKAHTVTLQTGAVQMKAKTILGSRDVPWDSKSESSYQLWLEQREEGKVFLRFAQNRRIPTAQSADHRTSVEGWRFNIEGSDLKLPAAVHIWVGLSNGHFNPTRSKINCRPATPATLAESCATWKCVSYSPLTRLPGGWHWALGRISDRATRAEARFWNCVYACLPQWVARSFQRHHEGEDGVRRLAVWPAQGQVEFGHSCILATAGEFDVWVFNSQGQALYHCAFGTSKVWSVAILGTKALSDCLELRLLIGCVQGKRMLHEQLVTVDNPSGERRCKLRERTVGRGDGGDSGAWGGSRGHTEAVTGIFTDWRRGLVYTVSYDKTAIQWDQNGGLLFQARGFHREKIYNGALSAGGCWLATAGFDHVALFSAHETQGLRCVALVDHDWENPEIDRRWFSAAFLPQSMVEEKESASELPSAIVVGDMVGNMWLVSLRHRDGTRRRTESMTRFISAVNEGVSLEPHKDCVRQLCWVDGGVAAGIMPAGTVSSRLKRRRSCCCLTRSCCCVTSQRSHAQPPTNVEGDSEITVPLLCTTSSDRTVRLYDAKDINVAVQALLNWHAPCTDSGATSQTSMQSESPEPITYAIEMVFHEAPVRAAGVDAFGHLYTASRRIAKWDDLPSCYRGDRVLQPNLCVREAYYLEVSMYFSNVMVFALQVLFFSSNRGVFKQSEDAKSTMAPFATITAAAVFENWTFLPEGVRPFWRTSISLVAALMVVVCPCVLRIYWDAEMRYDMDEHDHNNRNRQWWRKLRCYLFSFIFFGLLVIPTFKEFAVLLNCQLDEDGRYRMAADSETVCFVGLHLAMAVLCLLVGSLYLACGLLFETVNFDLSSLLESKLGSSAAFPTNRQWKVEDVAQGVSTREITLRRLFYVMFRHLSPDIRLESPEVNIGVFTQTSWAAHSRHMRFLSKVLLAIVDRLSVEWAVWQMGVVLAISAANLLVNWLLPPMQAPQLKWGIITVQASITAGGAIALSALARQKAGGEGSGWLHAMLYLIAVIAPFWIYFCVAPGVVACRCRRARADTASTSHRAGEKGPVPRSAWQPSRTEGSSNSRHQPSPAAPAEPHFSQRTVVPTGSVEMKASG